MRESLPSFSKQWQQRERGWRGQKLLYSVLRSEVVGYESFRSGSTNGLDGQRAQWATAALASRLAPPTTCNMCQCTQAVAGAIIITTIIYSFA